jgi:hypothetical protein
VIHIENLLRQLQLSYFNLWPIYWLSLSLTKVEFHEYTKCTPRDTQWDIVLAWKFVCSIHVWDLPPVPTEEADALKYALRNSLQLCRVLCKVECFQIIAQSAGLGSVRHAISAIVRLQCLH